MVLKIQQNARSFVGKATNYEYKALKYHPLTLYISIYNSNSYVVSIMRRETGRGERCICALSRGTREPSCMLGVLQEFCLRLPTRTKKCSIISHIAPLFPI